MNAMKLPGYGAVELKAGYNRNLGLALGIAVILHVAFIGLYLVFRGSTAISTTPVIESFIPVITPPVVIADDAYEISDGGTPGGSGVADNTAAETVNVTGTQEIAGAIVVPSPDDSLAGPFASMSNISTALPVLGTSSGVNDPRPTTQSPSTTSNRNGGGYISDRHPDPDEFMPVEQLPVFDIAELQRNLKYPELARRTGIEGTIVVRVLIDRQGRAIKTMIDASDNIALESAASDAVLATTFTPALQNKVPTAVWMQVPVVFRLQ